MHKKYSPPLRNTPHRLVNALQGPFARPSTRGLVTLHFDRATENPFDADKEADKNGLPEQTMAKLPSMTLSDMKLLETAEMADHK